MSMWTNKEIAVLHRLYPDGGAEAVHAVLRHRSVGTIRVMAHKECITVRRGSRRFAACKPLDDAGLLAKYPFLFAKTAAIAEVTA